MVAERPSTTLMTNLVCLTIGFACGNPGVRAGAQLASSSEPGRERVIFGASEKVAVETLTTSPDGRLIAMLLVDYREFEKGVASVILREMNGGAVRFSGKLGDVGYPRCADGMNALRNLVNCRWQIGFSPNGKLLAAGAVGCQRVKCWEVLTGKECLDFSLEKPAARQLFRQLWFSADGRTLILDLPLETLEHGPDAWAEELLFFDTEAWRLRSRLQIPDEAAFGTADGIYAAALRQDGTAFFTVGHDNQMMLMWDLVVAPPRVRERRQLTPIDAQRDHGTEQWLAFSPDCSALFFSGRIVRWAGDKEKATLLKDYGDRDPDFVTFSSDGRLVCGIRSFDGIETPILDAPISAPKSLIGVAGLARPHTVGEAVVWETKTGKRVGLKRWPHWSASFGAVLPVNDGIIVSDGSDVRVCQLNSE